VVAARKRIAPILSRDQRERDARWLFSITGFELLFHAADNLELPVGFDLGYVAGADEAFLGEDGGVPSGSRK